MEVEVLFGEVLFGFQCIDDLNPCSVRVINTSWEDKLLSCSLLIVNFIDGLIEFT